MKAFSVARDFSRFPAGRSKQDGPHSGEHLREILIPKLHEGKLHVDLDGTLGYGSSFLEEAFGRLKETFTLEHLKERLTLTSKDASLPQEIWAYLTYATSPPLIPPDDCA